MRVQWIDDAAVNDALDRNGMTLGPWHRVHYRDAAQHEQRNWRNMPGPRDARRLLAFSQNCVDWLPEADGYLVVFENSNGFTDVQSVIVAATIGADPAQFATPSGGLMVTDDDGRSLRIRLSSFVMLCLMFGAHAAIVSVGAPAGPILSLSDEYAYVIGTDIGDDHLDAFVETLTGDKLKAPEWAWGRWPGEPP